MDTRPSAPPSGERLYALQVLRFFAAAAVLFVHTLHEGSSFSFIDETAIAGLTSLPWGAGVDVFFVISGFIMYFIAGGTFGQPGATGRFLMRRFGRLVPIYWLFTGLMLLSIALFSAEIAHASFNAAHIIASFAFVPWINDTGDVQPVLALGWTLNYEVYFYVLFGLALLLPRRVGLVLLIGLFVVLALANPWVPASAVQLNFWSNPIIIEFLLGMGLAALRRSGLTVWAPLAWSLVGLGIVALFTLYPVVLGPYQRLLTAGVPAALIVAGCAFLPFDATSRLGRGLVLGGDASYALYLSHPFSINLVALVMLKTHHLIPGWVFVPLAIIAALVGSLVVHLLIERPLTERLNRRLAPRAKASRKVNA
jgi:exopolysaccharide production protein ExoZ